MKTILIIDDEAFIAELVGEILKDCGYSTLLANDGAKALDYVAGEKLDLIITDNMMPQVTGIELCRRIQSNSRSRSFPIILMSAGREPENGGEFYDTYIRKPFLADEIVEAVEAVLEKYSHGTDASTSQ